MYWSGYFATDLSPLTVSGSVDHPATAAPVVKRRLVSKDAAPVPPSTVETAGGVTLTCHCLASALSVSRSIRAPALQLFTGNTYCTRTLTSKSPLTGA